MDLEIKAREGDLLETHEGFIFDVKGLIHPSERIIAYLRYYPDTNGDRVRKGIRYKKLYSLEDRYEFLETNYPQYLFNDKTSGEVLQGVRNENIKQIYRPAEFLGELHGKFEDGRLEEVSPILRKAFELVKLLHSSSGVKFEKLGITGSCLVNLETEQSDIDLIIYGSKNAFLVRKTLITLHDSHRDIIHPYSQEDIVTLYEFRGKQSDFNFQEFVKIEQRKKLQGLFRGTDYYIRCIKDWDEISNENV
ncbi:unnamed protein product, partial [marine sediment metagenome]